MTVRGFRSVVPGIAPSAWVSEAAYVVGSVTIREGSSVWPGAVLRGDFGHIDVGKRSHIEDNCVLHTADSLTVGDDVIIGHGAVLHCRSVGDSCLIGNRAVILDDAEVGEWCTVASGALIPPRTVVPARSFVVGLPCEIRPATPAQLDALRAMQQAQVTHGYGALLLEYKQHGL